MTGENETFNRPSIVNHSINGSFAIRKEDYKLIMAPGSGGWSKPAPNNKAAIDTLPPVQLYNLKDDPGEINNIVANNPELLAELTTLLNKYINEGRSTDGVVQENDTGNWWKQLTWIENPNETDNEKTRE